MASSSGKGRILEVRKEPIILEEEETEVLRIPGSNIEEVAIDTRWCLVGKLLTGRVSDFNVFQNMMAFLWQSGMGMYVKELNPNLFLVQFYHEIDIQRVIDGSPWSYDQKPFIFTRLKDGDNPRLVEINHLDMWVQIHNLQTGNMTLSVVMALENYIDTFIESDPNNFVGVWRDYLHVRFWINVDKPIKRRMKIRHSEKFCPRLFLKPLHLQEKPYSLELRASAQRRQSTFGAQWLRSGAAGRSSSKGTLGINDEDLTLNVNSNGNFFDSTITTMVDSKRRKPDSNLGNFVGPRENEFSDIIDDMEQGVVGLPKNGSLTSMESIRAHLGFEGCFVVDARGHSGGLALLWKDASEVVIQGFSFNHIDATVQMLGFSPWRFTGVYGEPKRELRFQIWDLFRSLKNDSNLPWCLMGDMNNLGSHLEKKGGRKYPDRLIKGFTRALDDCNLLALPLVGYPYTWEKGRNSSEWIEERLDRALVTNEWLNYIYNSIRYIVVQKINIP
uniref:DUF4283 domain-containing protein n=1 Tax=Cannabis sativa TaxID=3483 RepID=A0A803NZ69_CANSA